MYSLFLAAAAFIAVFFGFWKFEISSLGWSIFWGFFVFAITVLVINLIIRRRITDLMAETQEIMNEGQRKIQVMLNRFQNRPTGDPKRLMAEAEKMQNKVLAEALEFTDRLEPFRNWMPLFGKQLNTTRMQYLYQMKNFKKVDELMPKCIILDSMSASMKLARLYSNKAEIEEIEKVFNKSKSRLRYNQSALLYALMGWIYIKKNMPEKAHTTLVQACKDNENETLKRNLDRLANKKVREYNNAGFGDEWYALYLENPKIQYRRQQPRMDGRPF